MKREIKDRLGTDLGADLGNRPLEAAGEKDPTAKVPTNNAQKAQQCLGGCAPPPDPQEEMQRDF